MARDEMLNADTSPAGAFHVLLRVRGIRYDTLAAVAEMWLTDRDLVEEHLDRLAAVVERRGAQWDAEVDDAECSWQMDEAHVELDETQALQLADELRDAAGRTFGHESRAAAAIPFPHQQNRSAA
ncbi:hypothetical protein [Kitasatospora sp. NPDC050543]|uniref:hypothetical protein n=1 Tax=Kitasatospora sp. NPDC050543 TaxID=3364054 RepID=UPI0037912AD5